MSVLLERPLVELSRKNLSICILDDEADHVELTSRRLEDAGFPVSETTSAQEALQKVRSGSCRVIVADLKMPAMDGLAFLEKALQCDPGIYVILVTGFYTGTPRLRPSSTALTIICASQLITRGCRRRWMI
jgi:CheY-like chemotaxis protein